MNNPNMNHYGDTTLETRIIMDLQLISIMEKPLHIVLLKKTFSLRNNLIMNLCGDIILEIHMTMDQLLISIMERLLHSVLLKRIEIYNH